VLRNASIKEDPPLKRKGTGKKGGGEKKLPDPRRSKGRRRGQKTNDRKGKTQRRGGRKKKRRLSQKNPDGGNKPCRKFYTRRNRKVFQKRDGGSRRGMKMKTERRY